MLETITNSTDEVQYVYLNATHVSPPSPILAIVFGSVATVAFFANLSLLLYIVVHKLYHNFISSHFIAHLCVTNMLATTTLIPIFIYTVWTGENMWQYNHYLCRIQALFTCSVWTVMAMMALCISGVHLLTFARIHYEQLFGLPPNMLCALSWVISLALALPSLTNGHIVIYDPSIRHCIWGHSDSGLKFLTYLLILGVFLPVAFSSYAYIRVLGILYHSPIVFQSIGLYKSRFLVYAFLLAPFYQAPIYIITMMRTYENDLESIIPMICLFVAYTNVLFSPVLYGASLFMMKEEDMALTARAHKNAPGYHQHHNLQAQLI